MGGRAKVHRVGRSGGKKRLRKQRPQIAARREGRLRDAARKALQAEAVIVSGGAPLGLQGQRRPSERGEDYFEGTNAFAVGAEAPVFEARLDAVDFNDGLRLVAPHE